MSVARKETTMLKKGLTGLLLVFVSSAAVSQSFGPAVTINDVEVPRSKVQAQADHLINQRGIGSGGITQPSAYRKIQEEVIEQIVVQELLWQEAQRRGTVVGDDEVDRELDRLKSSFESELAFTFKIEEGGFTEQTFRENIRQQMSVQGMIANDITESITVDATAIETFYNENLEQMAVPERVHARHILVKFESGNDESRAAAEKKLAGLAAQVKAGESFALLAIEHSEGPSGQKGGDLGYFERGQMVQEFDEVAFGAEPGSIVGPVETQFGLHLIKVEEHTAPGTVPLAEVEPQIREYLVQQTLYGTVEQLVEDLRATGDVEVHLW
jgi:peptidyl-prolyl cis-trans isomerase C